MVVVQLREFQLSLQVLLYRRENLVHIELAFHIEFAVFGQFALQALVQAALLDEDQASEEANPDHHQQRRTVAKKEQEQMGRSLIILGGFQGRNAEQFPKAVGHARDSHRGG